MSLLHCTLLSSGLTAQVTRAALDGGWTAVDVVTGGHNALLGAAVVPQGAAEAGVHPGQRARLGPAAASRAAELQLIEAPGLAHAWAAVEHMLEARPEPGPPPPHTHTHTDTHTHTHTRLSI